MNAIVPRWEWRTFGSAFRTAEEAVAGLECERTESSDEVYLLSPANDAAVKIRGGLMDIKELTQVSEAGLEQWRPAMKEKFPLPQDEAEKVCAALGVSGPPPDGDAYSQDEFLAVLADPSRGVRAVDVFKHRRHYTFAGCMVEMTEVIAADQRLRTLAVESEDAASVLSAVGELGLTSRANTSYPRWLKAAVGMGG